MTSNHTDPTALKARIARLEQTLARLTTEAQSPLQAHFDLLLGSGSQHRIKHSADLLSNQLGIQALTLWSVDKTLRHWQLIAGETSDPPDARDAAVQSLSAGADILFGEGLLIPIQIQQQTQAVLHLSTPVAEPLLSFARQVAILIHDCYQKSRPDTGPACHEQRLRYAIHASSGGLWDWNLKNNRIYFDRSYLRLQGYDCDSVAGTLDTLKNDFIHPEDLDKVLEEVNSAIASQQQSLCLEHRMIHRNGDTVWIQCQCLFTEPDEQGRPTRCVSMNSEITQIVANRKALIQAKAEAELAGQTKSKFLASMSHEIRTPLNAILGLSHLLNDTRLDAHQKGYLTNIHHAANSLLQTVNQVFDYAKLDSGHIILENAHFDLEQVFECLSRRFESSAVHKPVNIIFDIADDVPRFLRGDAVRLGHIISHLVSNALQYSNSHQVVVKTQCENIACDTIDLRFCIIDHGTGLSPETLQILREKLNTKSHKGVSDKYGFGLQICKLLVSLMHGTIDIFSTPGKGSTFSFNARFGHSQIGDRQINSNGCRSLRLLVIDDNQLALEILAKSAGKLVDHVDTASDAEEAVRKIRQAEHNQQAYDLLLLDYKMPLQTGLETAKEIKLSDDIIHKPKIFLISSFQRDEIFTQYKDSDHVDDFLNKPVSESRLFDAICRAIPACITETDEDLLNQNHKTLKGKRVLVVEDNAVNQQVAQGILKKQGVDVTCAENGKIAVKCLQEQTLFDAVLMDIEMPVLNGIDATRIIRTLPHRLSIPIIAVTAQAMPGDREKCLKAGMNEYISKPIKPQALYQILSDLLERQESTVKN